MNAPEVFPELFTESLEEKRIRLIKCIEISEVDFINWLVDLA